MTKNERYNLIKEICERKQADDVGQLPCTEADIQDEFCRLQTHLEKTNYSWENDFLKNLIFGTD